MTGPYVRPWPPTLPNLPRISSAPSVRATSLSASKVNSLSTPTAHQQATVAASGSLAPVAYGYTRLGGMIFAQGIDSSGNLVLGYAWCVGECEEVVSVTFNDAPPPTGVVLTHYLGTTSQTPDSTLTSTLAGYDDAMIATVLSESVGICYTVAVFPPSAIGGFPKASAIIKGRKVYDPRDGTQSASDPSTWKYSTNPALCAGDLITSSALGLDRTVSDLSTAADHCDELMSDSSKRCEVGIALTQPRAAADYVDLLCTYAECQRIDDGTDIRLVPMAPVSGVAQTVTEADIVKDTLSVSVADLSDAPTRVEVTYTDVSSTTAPWQSTTAAVDLDGVSVGTKPRVVSRISLPGIQTYEQAYRQAMQRLVQARTPISAQWTTFDVGIVRQIGDVVRVHHSVRGIDIYVRIKSVEFAAAGRYKIAAAGYCDAQSVSAVVTQPGTTTVPVGVIAPMVSGSVPSGWSAWSSADGNHLVGAGNNYAVGDTGGGGTVTVSGTTDTQGAHYGDIESAFIEETGSGNAPEVIGTGGFAGGHTHAFDGGTVTPLAPHQDYPLAIKTGSASAQMPANLGSLANKALSHPSIAEQSPFNGLLKSASASGSGGSWSQSVSVTLTSAGAHVHWQLGGNSPAGPSEFGDYEYYGSSAGAHDHAGSTVGLVPDSKRLRWLLYAGSQDYPILAGMALLWAGSLSSPPSGWALCDGSSGTPDARDRFIELTTTADGDQGSTAGTDAADYSSATLSDGDHDHWTGSSETGPTLPYATIAARHKTSTGSHTHTMSGSQAWKPPYYGIGIIMYVGGDSGAQLEPYNPAQATFPTLEPIAGSSTTLKLSWAGGQWAYCLGYLIRVKDSTGTVVQTLYEAFSLSSQSYIVTIRGLTAQAYTADLYIVSSVEAVSATAAASNSATPGSLSSANITDSGGATVTDSNGNTVTVEVTA